MTPFHWLLICKVLLLKSMLDFLGWNTCHWTNINININYFYFPFLFYTPAQNWHTKIWQIIMLRICLLALMPDWQSHRELQWTNFPFKLVNSALRQDLFILLYYRQEGRVLSPESTRLYALMDADLTKSQCDAIDQAALDRQVITVSEILKGISQK